MMSKTREQVIDRCVEDEIEMMNDEGLDGILREGCRGYNAWSNDELEEYYEEQFGDEIVIVGSPDD